MQAKKVKRFAGQLCVRKTISPIYCIPLSFVLGEFVNHFYLSKALHFSKQFAKDANLMRKIVMVLVFGISSSEISFCISFSRRMIKFILGWFSSKVKLISESSLLLKYLFCAIPLSASAFFLSRARLVSIWGQQRHQWKISFGEICFW